MQDSNMPPVTGYGTQVPPEIPGFTVPSITVSAAQGGAWIGDGWRLFSQQPWLWIVATLILVVISFTVSYIPLIGQIAGALIGPSLAVGILSFAHALAQGQGADLNHIFDGFRERLAPLIMVGLLYLALILVALLVCGVVFFVFVGSSALRLPRGSEQEMLHQLMSSGLGLEVLLALLVFMALLIPVMAAYWFAPALVYFCGLSPVDAMKESLWACLRNWLPMLVYSFILTLMLILAALPLMLGLIVAVPVMMASYYCSFKDLFSQRD